MIFSRFRFNEKTILELTSPKSAYLYSRKTRLNLVTGYPEVYAIEDFFKEFSRKKLHSKVASPEVYHFYYEYGMLLNGLGHLVDDSTPLVLTIEYQQSRKVSPRKTKLTALALKTLERPNWTEYKRAFERIQEHLLSGNCYQVNLTCPFDFETADVIDPRDICDFFFSRPNLGAYAHATYFGEEMFLSNSPECLFQYQNGGIFTMPIKGTKPITKNWKDAWKEMLQDEKEEAELIMISDLLKNDLNRLDRPIAKVIKRRAPLLVPGLLHQYSLLSVKLGQEINLGQVLSALFPGGSITGAPKKRVMEIIHEIEYAKRGIYTGTTLLCYQDKKVASVNIRTATISPADRLWRYGAGGGITLLSRPASEFQEMESKVKSFLTLIKSPGY